MKWLIPIAATVCLALWLAQRATASAEPEADQGASLLDDAMTAIDPSTYTTPAVSQEVADGNVAAFLETLKYSEGTNGPESYRTLFGGGLFDSFADHPRIAQQFTNRAGKVLWTSAAGAYQMMAVSPLPTGGTTHVDTWDKLKAKLQLPDFSPASQDAAAIELIRQRGALGDVMAGRFASACAKCAPVWASLPGSNNDQRESDLSNLLLAFQAAGGITEA